MAAQAIALSRFGLGAAQGQTPPPDLQRWLASDLERYEARPPTIAAIEPSTAIAARFLELQRQYRSRPVAAGADRSDGNPAADYGKASYVAQVQARFAAAVSTPSPFAERLVHFWANHFAISVDKPALRALGGTLEFEAIRPHLVGRFEDMLLAVVRHPAMQVYLDQVRSTGPTSFAARKGAQGQKRPIGLNENLAREILELHTLGAGGGYSQADVAELARALTGWTIGGFGRGTSSEPGRFFFRWNGHEPGERVMLGRRYGHGGVAQGEAMLRDLAIHPSTARHLATKVARHFVADKPPDTLVQRLEAAFLQSGGSLPAVYRALIAAPEVWALPQSKFKSPWEWIVSASRGLGLAPEMIDARRLLNELGQPVWQPRSPAGWPDSVQAWASSSALLNRVSAAMTLAQASRLVDPLAAAHALLPGVLSRTTGEVVARAEGVHAGLAVLICSPEFLRR